MTSERTKRKRKRKYSKGEINMKRKSRNGYEENEPMQMASLQKRHLLSCFAAFFALSPLLLMNRDTHASVQNFSYTLAGEVTEVTEQEQIQSRSLMFETSTCQTVSLMFTRSRNSNITMQLSQEQTRIAEEGLTCFTVSDTCFLSI